MCLTYQFIFASKGMFTDALVMIRGKENGKVKRHKERYKKEADQIDKREEKREAGKENKSIALVKSALGNRPSRIDSFSKIEGNPSR